MNRSINIPLPGPGDFLPGEDPDLSDYYVEQAREEVEANADDPADVTTDAIIARAWALQDAADRDARESEAEITAWCREDLS